jgi:hypothetical protein
MIRKALIIGGGIGGLSAAIALRRAGIAVDLVELQTDFKVYHVGVIVQGNFVRAMEALGIVDEAVAAGYPLNGVIFPTLDGHVLADIPGVKLASPRPPHVDRMMMCVGLKGGKCGFVPLTPETGYVLLVQEEPGNPRHPPDRLADIFRERLAARAARAAAARTPRAPPTHQPRPVRGNPSFPGPHPFIEDPS